MCTIFEIAQPGLELLRVVLVDHVAVDDHIGGAGDGGPFACTVEEGHVDVVVFGEVVGFAGFGVGVEDQVDAAGFLKGIFSWVCVRMWTGEIYLTCDCHAAGDEEA